MTATVSTTPEVPTAQTHVYSIDQHDNCHLVFLIVPIDPLVLLDQMYDESRSFPNAVIQSLLCLVQHILAQVAASLLRNRPFLQFPDPFDDRHFVQLWYVLLHTDHT